ncbi:MAG: OPT/YSL family transporter [Deltaproteobacteria bacterium]|nr:OPT/YSL family transporter [Deltaproteobacteria bacterium]
MKSKTRKMHTGPYREVTIASLLTGIAIGVVMVASITYSGLVVGFTIVGSSIAAIAGFGILRGILRRGTIVENNIVQTVASSLNVASAGVIFTVPVLYLRGEPFSLPTMVIACISGSFLGFFFIIPLRKQMIDLERLRFPSGVAVATILRSPGAGLGKLALLGAGIGAAALITVITQAMDTEVVDLNRWLVFIPKEFTNTWALSLMCVGAGYLTGRNGILVLVGGILSYWIITPAAIYMDWLPLGPHGSATEMIDAAHKEITRPMGIGMLVGGAVSGILVSLPAIRAAFAGLLRAKVKGGTEEMPAVLVGIGAAASFAVLLATAMLTSDISFLRALLIATVGTVWLALAGVVISQCTGMTDWSPISGISMMGVAIVMWLSGENVVLSVTLGAAICMSLSQCSDIMQDLKTGFLVGAKPVRQQAAQLAVTWIGPIVAMAVVYVLAQSQDFGTKALPAPQATALSSTITAISGGEMPIVKYLSGLMIGGAVSIFGVPGLGVLIGLSMYLPMEYVLTYGLGCLINMGVVHFKGGKWAEEKGLPVAAGFIVGEALVSVVISMAKVLGGAQ